MKKLIFLATEDWFVRSHFLPLVRRAQAEGYDVAVAARDSGALREEGVRVIAMPFARGSFNPITLWRERDAVRALLNAERPAIVHAIALKPILLSLLAGPGGTARVLALTGRGYLGASASWFAWGGPGIARAIREAVRRGFNLLMVENQADRAWIEAGAALPDARVVLMPGAGVDPTQFPARPEPAGPVVIGAASRLIRSKGVDLLIEAQTRLRAEGRDVRVHIAGDADAHNPEAVGEETLQRWRETPGVTLLGRVSDIAGFWASAHIACFPTRGGEGLPRSLLEAASCARPLVVTDTPGCADFVRPGVEGLVVPPNSAFALAEALAKLIDDASLRQSWGANARRRVLEGYTEAHAADVAAAAWARLI